MGSHTEEYDNYLKRLIVHLKIKNNVIMEGYQDKIEKYYEIFDFIKSKLLL